MNDPIRIIIAEDHPVMREALHNLLTRESAVSLVAEAKNGAEALALIEQQQPDIALLDISMGRPNEGFEVARVMQQREWPVKVIFMSGQDYSEALLRDFVHRALELKAAGFVLKSGSSSEIMDGIRAVAAGQRYFSGRLTPHMVDLHHRAQTLEQQYPALNELSRQERRILLLLADALTAREIAAALTLSHRTVENHLNHLRGKLNLKGHNHLLKFAIEHKTELLMNSDDAE